MSLSTGTKLGPYEILARIGAGGMGEVYRARDGRLGRDVALKVLPEAFANDGERMARFEREAKVLAALNHPNIAALYGLEESGGVRALVMELVEGATLAERIEEGALAVEEALAAAQQIAEALEYAHERGVIHRDLKPANVKLTGEGQVKVLDFGLGKALDAEPGATPTSSHSPTLSLGATRAGVILGTAAYMAPEQAKGKPVDRRADIWAYGVVVYEMVTGRRLYEGETAAETLAAVMMKEAGLEGLPAGTPEAIRRLLRRCLDKDPKRRLQAIGEARIAIEEALSGATPEVPAAPPASGSGPSRRPVIWMAVAAVLALSTATVSFVHFREAQPEARVFQFSIPPPEKTTFGEFAISPDGRRLAFTAQDDSGKRQLWARPLDSLAAQMLHGTGEASFPFWSPDSRYIGFFAGGKLKKIAATGGPPQTLCDALNGRGGTWSRDGVIVFAPTTGSVLYRVPAAGGEAKPATSFGPSQISHRQPHFLPDGRHFLYWAGGGEPGIYLGSLEDETPQSGTRLLGDNSHAAYGGGPSGSGYLVFRRDETLMAQPFDAARRELAGEAVPVAERADSAGEAMRFSVSENGVLAYEASGSRVRLTWVDRTGKRLGTVGGPGIQPWLSPDEKKVAVEQAGPQAGWDIWLFDLVRGTSSRFTFDPGNDLFPVWSPDGSRIVFCSNREGFLDLYQKAASGAGQEELLVKSNERKTPSDWSLDGRLIAYTAVASKTGLDIWVLSLTGDRKPTPFLQTPFNEQRAVFSPDGRWIAYVSDESRRSEVYVQPIPATGAKWQVSSGGGTMPKWRRDGKELYYVDAESKLMAVEVRAGASFEAGIPRALFQTGLEFFGFPRYAVTGDGQRFLMNAPETEAPVATPVTVVVNWTTGLRL